MDKLQDKLKNLKLYIKHKKEEWSEKIKESYWEDILWELDIMGRTKRVITKVKEFNYRSLLTKRNGIIAAVILVCLIPVGILVHADKDIVDLNDYKGLNQYDVNGLKYNIPNNWVRMGPNASAFRLYNENKDVVGYIHVRYIGETDLTEGDAKIFDFPIDEGYLKQVGSMIYMEDFDASVETITLEDLGCIYKEEVMDADSSRFVARVFVVEDKVEGADEFFREFRSFFRTSWYSNPRELDSIKIHYTGKTKEGTVIDSNTKDVKAVGHYKTLYGTGTKDLPCRVQGKVELVAGKTSHVEVVVFNVSHYIDVKCTTKDRSKEATEWARKWLIGTTFENGGVSRPELQDKVKDEGFSTREAKYAVEHSGVIWRIQALNIAKKLTEPNVQTGGYSQKTLRGKLSTMGFTEEEIAYALSSCKADWNKQALYTVISYYVNARNSGTEIEKSDMRTKVLAKGFTEKQVDWAIARCGYYE